MDTSTTSVRAPTGDPPPPRARWPLRACIAGGGLLVALALGAVAFTQFGGPPPDAALAARLAAAAERPAGHVVRIADLTDFAWERLHAFGPYSSTQAVEAELGFAWSGAADTDIDWNEGIALLVFVADGAVVRHVVQGRRSGDFSQLAADSPFTPESAVFVLRVEDMGEPWRVWRPAGSD